MNTYTNETFKSFLVVQNVYKPQPPPRIIEVPNGILYANE